MFYEPFSQQFCHSNVQTLLIGVALNSPNIFKSKDFYVTCYQQTVTNKSG